MLRSTILASLLSLAAAQNKTLEWFFPGAEGSDLVASIVSANPSTTVAVLNCPTSVDSSDCGFGPGVSLSIISTTIYQAVMSESDFTMSVSCVYKTSEMPCSVSIAGGNDPGNTVETFSGSDIGFLTATVTAGGEKLSASAGGASLSACRGAEVGRLLLPARRALVPPIALGWREVPCWRWLGLLLSLLRSSQPYKYPLEEIVRRNLGPT
ncbi:hypothetical protein BCR34DRAFT_362213 [Clohesyomyces aquaticus]|uniref:Uncharacterized protein n=1 Tax=Clohesyomyces aquaticus TaxID=1231657 RepID=A0A1Y2A6Z6_9PLEO|nr:hypothetical protein BCR34DRAFT_362213 [Clohesyomyces aquaticus]